MLNSVPRTPSSWTIYSILCSILAATIVRSACVDNSTDTAGLQKLLTDGGEGYTLSLCAGQVYSITQSLNFTNTSQEISTEGYPTDSTRAMLVVSGPKTPQVNHTTAVLGDCENCDFIRIRNIMIDGDRDLENMAPLPGGGNIEIGGANQGQIVENVRSFNPRGWSCLHIAEGPFACSNATIRGNDIGPCGSDYFQYWADGVSLSCANSLVENNDIKDATDAGIVVFGSPGSTIRNNTISATDRVMLGGINMVDFDPWQGNFSNLLVENNRIYGGFADEYGNSSLGVADQPAVIKLGMAIGPLTWWGDERYGTNTSSGPATVVGNVYSGAMVFAVAIAGARNFALINNTLYGNTTFAGSYAVNCTTGADKPHEPTPFLISDITTNTTNITIDNMNDFVEGTAGGLTCFGVMQMPELDEYPYGPNFNWTALAAVDNNASMTTAASTAASTGLNMGSATGTDSVPSPSVAPQNSAERNTLTMQAIVFPALLLAIGAVGLI